MNTNKIILFFLSLLSVAISANSQYIVHLKDGRIVELTGLKEDHSISLDGKIRQSGEKISLKNENVLFYNSGGYNRYYMCPDGKRCEYYPRVINGRIEVFEVVTYQDIRGHSYSYFFYARKDNVSNFLISKNAILAGDRNGKEKLMELISDDEELLNRIKSGEFKFKYDEVVDLIMEYNVKHYNPELVNRDAQGNIVFYVKSKREPNPPLELIVNDTAKHAMPYNFFVPTQVHGDPAKICVGSSCALISPDRITMYWEIDYDQKLNKARFSRVEEDDAQRYLVFQRTK